MQTTLRTHNCSELRKNDVGKKVKLCGWVHRHRDLGGVLFITLRDRFGIVQLLFDPTKRKEVTESAQHLRGEWVIAIEGTVQERAEGMTNPNMATGDIEIVVDDLSILNQAETPPLTVSDEKTPFSEELRLKYRYLDLRRPDLTRHLVLRHRAMMTTRRFLDANHFLEIATPILAKSTPEGARDYLVPSRVYPGHCYALPQSPQIFKQLLMMGGLDRYFQISPCFRDEDLRSDRQPEFHQIDIEMSFASKEDLFVRMEGLIAALFRDSIHLDVAPPFHRMTYQEAMDRYGTDRPDTRFGMELIDATDLAKESSFTVFHEQIESGGIVKGFCKKGGATLSRKQTDKYTEFVKSLGLNGLSILKKKEGEIQSPLIKFFPSSLLEPLCKRFALEDGDLIFLATGKPSILHLALDHLRRKIAKDHDLIPKDRWDFLWIIDFPLFLWNEDDNRMESVHHPFTRPLEEDLPLLDIDPLSVRSSAYDLVLNGCELGGGSQRIHEPALQQKIFELLNIPKETIQQKFGFFLQALQYGTPPHLGIAFGFDRIIMLLAGTDNIRDVIAFPKTIRAQDLLLESPAEVPKEQLDEIHIQFKN